MILNFNHGYQYSTFHQHSRAHRFANLTTKLGALRRWGNLTWLSDLNGEPHSHNQVPVTATHLIDQLEMLVISSLIPYQIE